MPNVSYCENEKEVHYNPLQTFIVEYTTSDGNILERRSEYPFEDESGNDITIVSDTYENGKGIWKLTKKPYKISSGAFYGTEGDSYDSTLTSIAIPNSITSIGGSAFQYCSRLTDIIIPNNVTYIGGGAFMYCTSLTGITIPDSVTFIASSVFSNCASLTGITIPDSVTSIRDNAFNGCSSLVEINIPNSVTSIGGHAFYGCTSLTSIIIPDSIIEIGAYAFFDWKSLSTISINATTPPTLGSGAFGSNSGRVSNLKIYVPSGSVDAYKSATNWSAYKDIIQAIE